MTQELIDLRTCIKEGRYADALVIVDELEGMSKQAILRNLQSLSKILLIPLINNKLEQRLTNSWAASIRNSLIEIKKINLKENKKSYYINQNEWNIYLEDELEIAVRDASLEVFNGIYNEFKLIEMVDRNQVIEASLQLLELTYSHAIKDLPAVIAEKLTQLPSGEEWKLGKR